MAQFEFVKRMYNINAANEGHEPLVNDSEPNDTESEEQQQGD